MSPALFGAKSLPAYGYCANSRRWLTQQRGMTKLKIINWLNYL